jgi:hypothetical protein
MDSSAASAGPVRESELSCRHPRRQDFPGQQEPFASTTWQMPLYAMPLSPRAFPGTMKTRQAGWLIRASSVPPPSLVLRRERLPSDMAARPARVLQGRALAAALGAACRRIMYRRSSLRKLAAAAGELEVAMPQAQQRIMESSDPTLNCDLEREPDAQPGK